VALGVSAGVLALVTAVLASWALKRSRDPGRAVRELVEPSLEYRLEVLSETMKRSARLLATVTAEMELRRTEVERLKEEQHTAEVNMTLSAEQRSALRAELAEAVRPETNRGIKWSVALSFISGALVCCT
jgi:hypothetical protein